MKAILKDDEIEQMLEEGDVVFSVEWDSNAPGMSGSEDVWYWDGKFYYLG